MKGTWKQAQSLFIYFKHILTLRWPRMQHQSVFYSRWASWVNEQHRHLREIDCSSPVAGGMAAGAEFEGKSIHWTHTWRQKVLLSGCCGWRQNYYSQQRQVGWANEQSTSLRCLWWAVYLFRCLWFQLSSWNTRYLQGLHWYIEAKDLEHYRLSIQVTYRPIVSIFYCFNKLKRVLAYY